MVAPAPSRSATATAGRLFAPGLLEPLIAEAVKAGLQQAGLPLPPALERMIVRGISLQADRRVNALVGEQKKKIDAAVSALKTRLAKDTQRSIDSASLAASAEIMPRLAKQKLGMRARTPDRNVPARMEEGAERPLPQKFLAGLGEAGGEEMARPPVIPEGAPSTAPPAMPETGIIPGEEEVAKIVPGREALPLRDLTPKQRAAFAQQELARQLATTGARRKVKGAAAEMPGEGVPTPEEEAATILPSAPPDELAALEQEMVQARQLRQTRASSPEQLTRTVRGARHKRHVYRKLVAAGETQQKGIQHRLMYLLGIGAMDRFGEAIGEKIQHNVRTGSFRGFVLALYLAIAKDLLDLIDTATFATVVAKIVIIFLQLLLSAIIGAILFGQGTYFKRKIIKKLFGRMIMVAIAGLVPGLNVFPEYTIGILLMKASIDKSIHKQKKAYEELQEQMNALRRLQRSGREIDPRRIAKIRAKLETLKKIANE